MSEIPFPSLKESPFPLREAVETDERACECIRFWSHNQFSLFNRFPIAKAVLASQRASRARKRRYENVRLKVSLAIHTCVHSGKENITVESLQNIFFLSFYSKTTTLTAVFLMDFFVFSVFCSLTTLYFWPYSAMLFLFVRQQLLLMSRPWSSSLSVLCLRRKLDR